MPHAGSGLVAGPAERARLTRALARELAGLREGHGRSHAATYDESGAIRVS